MIGFDELQDLQCDKLNINFVPKRASSTCGGCSIIKPIVKPIPYEKQSTAVELCNETKVEFNISDREID